MSLFTPDLSLVSGLYLSRFSNIMSLQVRFPAVRILLLTWLEAGDGVRPSEAVTNL